ncbi:hypothetical protein [Oceaniglobus indicus]|uniref:hypothetical protein n=1 Tax=Oceaniglobus indicus TaxID=2047749 RepID=UPI0011AB723C|nr:hypothetical protein [Oceaniglobus indicus]
MPKPLDMNRLKQFETKAITTAPRAAPPASPPEPERWPSREAPRDGQISIKAPLDTIERFKRLCRDDRRTYADMLRLLMDGHGPAK